MLLNSIQVDYVSLRDNKRLVLKSSEQGSQRKWTSENINP